MMLGEHPSRLAHLVTHRFDVGVIGVFVVIEHAEPVAAEVNQPLGIVGEPDDQRFLCLQQLGGQAHAGHERHIRRLDPAVCQIETGRGLRGPRYANQADIRIVDAPGRLPVIVIDRKSHRIDARKIFTVEQMLPARHAMARPPEIIGERPNHRIEHRNRLNLQLPAALL